jgi:hypothetical protein
MPHYSFNIVILTIIISINKKYDKKLADKVLPIGADDLASTVTIYHRGR